MPRIRTIKPDAFRSLTLSRVPVEARWLFAGLWTECDDSGRMRDHAGLIRAAIFPLDDHVTVDVVEGWLTALHREGSICRYSNLGENFLHVPGWEHQRINRASKSALPLCPTHRAAPEQDQLPMLTAVPHILDPRRCPLHQSGPPTRCGACKEARVAHEETRRDRPTLSGKTTMCGEHPTRRALNCPDCAAAVVPAPKDWKATS